MKLEHKAVGSIVMVSYLRDRQCNLKIGSPAREELEKVVIYIIGALIGEDGDRES